MLRSIPRPVFGDLTGALGDLGTVLPLAAGMILIAGIDPGIFFVTFGIASLLTGLVFRVPLPVQPQKAIAAAAIGQPWSAGLVHGAGLGSGLLWLAIASTPALRWLGRVVPRFIAQGVQIVLSATLAVEALRLMTTDLRFGAVALVFLVISFWARITALLLVVLVGVLVMPQAAWAVDWTPALPGLVLPRIEDVARGMLLGGFAQMPLTLANAILSTVALSAVYFPQRPLTERQLGLGTGVMNVGSALLGGVPLCYGAGGLAAQHLYGARTVWKNVVEGVGAIAIGTLLAPSIGPMLQAFPMPLLGGLLLLVSIELLGATRGLHGWRSWIVLGMVAIGLLTNIGVAFAAGLLAAAVLRRVVRRGWVPRLTRATPVEELHRIPGFFFRERRAS